jgi:GNAT superfamily N-acetyltransferase
VRVAETEQIVRADWDRYQQVRTLLGRAFEPYPLMVYAEANERRRLPAVALLYGAIMDDCFRHGEVYVTPQVTGACCWLPPERSTPTFWRQARSGMLKLPFYFGLGGFRKLTAYDEIARRLHHDHAPMPHYYLAAIGVDPDRQGQGIGTALMQPMLERIDQAGLHCWLDTHLPQNVRLYERHGFEVSEMVEPQGHPVPVWGMLRKPR